MKHYTFGNYKSPLIIGEICDLFSRSEPTSWLILNNVPHFSSLLDILILGVFSQWDSQYWLFNDLHYTMSPLFFVAHASLAYSRTCKHCWRGLFHWSYLGLVTTHTSPWRIHYILLYAISTTIYSRSVWHASNCLTLLQRAMCKFSTIYILIFASTRCLFLICLLHSIAASAGHHLCEKEHNVVIHSSRILETACCIAWNSHWKVPVPTFQTDHGALHQVPWRSVALGQESSYLKILYLATEHWNKQHKQENQFMAVR